MQKDYSSSTDTTLAGTEEPKQLGEDTPVSLDKTMWMQLVFNFGKKIVHSHNPIQGEHYNLVQFKKSLEADEGKALAKLKSLSLTVGICNAMKSNGRRVVTLGMAEDYGSLFYSQVMELIGKEDDSIIELEDGSPDALDTLSANISDSELGNP